MKEINPKCFLNECGTPYEEVVPQSSTRGCWTARRGAEQQVMWRQTGQALRNSRRTGTPALGRASSWRNGELLSAYFAFQGNYTQQWEIANQHWLAFKPRGDCRERKSGGELRRRAGWSEVRGNLCSLHDTRQGNQEGKEAERCIRT